MLEKCELFLAEYLPGNPTSSLLGIMYSHNMSSVDICMEKVKQDFTIIFYETLEKYVFVRLAYSELYELLKSRGFHSSDEYYLVKGIVLWITYDIDNRIVNAQSLLGLIDTGLCNKNIMLNSKQIDTGNCELDMLIKQLHVRIHILNDKNKLELMIYYKPKTIDSFNIPIHTKSPTIDIKQENRLYKVANDGIYDLSNKKRVFNYNFGKGNISIYINSNLLIINFARGNMLRLNTLDNKLTTCSYPRDYLFLDNSSPTVDKTPDGNLITIGGRHSNATASDRVKSYDIETDRWSDGTPLPYGVGDHATVVLQQDIYVIGGCSDTGAVTSKVIRYRCGAWNVVAPLLDNRRMHIALVWDNTMFVYGGYDGYNVTNGPEYYDIVNDVWTDEVRPSDVDTNVFTNVRIHNSGHDDQFIYHHSNNAIYCIDLNNYTKRLLYNDVMVSNHCLVIMNLVI